ncbi:MAG: lysophospholipase [Brevibacillus sp.]|nr:lysophospholipase [Brevibacillus sp.]
MRRQSGRLLWQLTGSIALLSSLLFACGFVFALKPHVLAPADPLVVTPEISPQEQPEAVQADGEWNVVALGDSLTRGTGDVNGQGYVGLFRQAYEQQSGQQLVLNNLAINGLTSGELLAQLEQRHVQELLSTADLILFTIGGNDLFRLSGGLYELDEQRIKEGIDKLQKNFTKVLERLRHHNQEAMIIYPALYNPFGSTEAASITDDPILMWNGAASRIAASFDKVIVVPTYDLFVHKEDHYLYSDHFHPNSAGYARIAERVLQAVR